MAILRATFFFKSGSGKYGWSETYFNMAPDLTSCMAKAKVLLPLSTAIRGSDTLLVFIRVSDDLVKRDSLVYNVPFADQASKSLETSDIPNTCLLVRMSGLPTVRRSLYLRGIPDNIVVDSGNYAPSPSFRTLFAAFKSQVITDAWAIKYKDPLVSRVPFFGFTQDFIDETTTITTAGPHGFVSNDAITIRGVSGATPLNGNWSVFSVVNATSFKIKQNQILSPWTGGGYVSKLEAKLTPITDVQDERITHRISGRPFDLPRGRRPARKRS